MEPVIFRPSDRPDVEALVDGDWLSGELRGWLPREGCWNAQVKYRLGPGHICVVSVPAEHIRSAGEDPRLQPPG